MSKQSNTVDHDVVIIGGGINGAGIARDASGRGYNILLVEKDDLGSHTSSASSKLIHGGLRYLEFYEFKLVREALNEREVLLNIAPHIIWPMRFVLPHHPSMRPSWMIRAGLMLYDFLGKRKKLPGSRGVSFQHHDSGKPLKKQFKKGFAYSDCWVQDSRLVVLNAMDAKEHGARILTHTKCVAAHQSGDYWRIELENKTGEKSTVTTKFLVNATGPWVSDFLSSNTNINHSHSIRLVSGSHIVVKKLFEHDKAYIFQNTDNRIVFAIPYENEFTLIGTTELDVENAAAQSISSHEINYLCQCVNQYFNQQISDQDVVWHYSGVRPLLEDGSDDATSTTREYVLDLVEEPVPCLSVFGGKITTYRSLAESALTLIDLHFANNNESWTGKKALPGGDIENSDFESFLQSFKQSRPWLPDGLAWHYVRNYGTLAQKICGQASSLSELGEDFGGGLYQCEVDYLIQFEWASTAEDILWRRTKWGLHTSRQTEEKITKYILDNQA